MLDIFVHVVFAFVAFAPLLWLVGAFNHMVRVRAQAKNSFANIDVLLRQRFDEIPKLVEVCKAYAAHESSTLQRVTAMRGSAEYGTGLGARLLFENELMMALGSLCGVVENYPELKADRHFIELQTRITEIENQIADRREHFNQAVTNYNTYIEEFPALLFARRFGFASYPVLEVPERVRQSPEVSLAGAQA